MYVKKNKMSRGNCLIKSLEINTSAYSILLTKTRKKKRKKRKRKTKSDRKRKGERERRENTFPFPSILTAAPHPFPE